MTNEEFDNLWKEAEAVGVAHKLAQEYPAWRQRQKRRRNNIIAAMFVGAAAVTTFPLLTTPSHDEYRTVCCNRANIDDSHWVALADEMLTIDMI